MMDDDHLKYKPNKLCGICGDKALGYNFNAITCEACKAFFRRNALRTKDFKCPFDGNCKIDLVTRRFCQKCRLKKCFDIGMKKEWILSEEEKRVKRDKIIENRRKKESTTSGHHNHHHHNHHHNHHRLMMMNGNTTTSNDDDGDDDDIIMSSITSQNSNHSDDNNSSSNHSFIVTNNNSMNNNKTLMNIPMGNGNVVVTHNNHQNARAINLDFQENSHHHHHHRNNQKENFFNSFYRFDHHHQQQQQYKCQQNLYLSGRFFPQFSSRISENNNNNNDLYSTTKFSNNIKPSSSSSSSLNHQSYQPNNHYTHHSLPPQYHHQYQHHYQQPPQPPQSQPLPQTQFHSSSSSLSYGKSMINPTTSRMSPTTITNNNNRPLSLTMKTNSFQGSSTSSSSSPSSSPSSSSALLCKNNNNNNSSNNNHHRNIDPDRLNIKIEYNNDGDHHLIQTNHITTHQSIDVHHQRPSTIFSLKTEPDDYINTISPPTTATTTTTTTTSSVKHIPSSSIINVNNENIKRRCHSDCSTLNSISIVDRSSLFINHSSDESESANIVFNVNHKDDSKEISHQSKIILKTENINKNDTSSSSSSPINDKTSSATVNVSFTLPNEEKFNLNNYDNLMKNDNGQSSNNGNTISIFQTNVNEMAPESISDQYNYIENYRLEELNDACNQLNHWYYNGSILYEMRHLKEIYRVAEHVFQHFISMAKMITAFADLCENDQISLLKYSVTEILILRSVSCFMPNKDAWIFNLDNNEKGTMLQFNTCKSQIPEFSDDIRHFILAVPEKCRQDRNLFDLATMVILFNPNCLDLKHKDVVKLEHITYCHLLCKYIHKNYSSTTTLTMEKSNEKHSIIQFNTMLNLIDQLHKINQKINNNILPFHTIINEEYDKKHLTQA